jgi:hypothetical protein
MVRSRVFGILAGYKDQNDHDTLRSEPSPASWSGGLGWSGGK